MKKTLLIICFIFLGLTLSGCNNISQNENTNQNIQEKDGFKKAELALVSFFSYLSDQKFEKALTLFELEDSTNSWEGLESFSLPEDRNNKAKVIERYCEATRTCLKAKVIETKKETSDTYNLLVQFLNIDGSIFVLWPCCGASEQEMPSQDKFNFKVKKINNIFKVTTAPIYVP